MFDLANLYQEIIIEHSQQPRNFGTLGEPCRSSEGFNPLCGDKITLYLRDQDSIITQLSFQGSGCAISTASASLMTEMIKGKTIQEALALIEEFQHLTTGKEIDQKKLGKLMALANISEFPMRVKCATLAWHTLKAVLTNPTKIITSTE